MPDGRVREGESAPDPVPLREADFYSWLAEQAAHARAGRLECLDLAGIAEEFEELMGDKVQEMETRLVVLYQHLLTYPFRREAPSACPVAPIVEQRQRLRRLIQRNPGMKPALRQALADPDLFIEGRDRAIAALFGAAGRIDLPDASPWSPDQLLDPGFWPGEGPHPERTGRQRARLGPRHR